MLIIPVIDISGGLVVHAKKGERNKYQPIQSILTSQTSPQAILESYFKLYPFRNIYIADLDAIQNKGDNFPLIQKLASNNPNCEFWLDGGINLIQNHPLFSEKYNIRFVIGSENEFSRNKYIELITSNPDLILSLDFGKEGLLNNNYLLNTTDLWPKDVIVLMLHRVGSNEGIDQSCLSQIKATSKKNRFYVAGGIRNISDIHSLENNGFNGVLLATALHNGAISKDDLINYKKSPE